MEAQNEKYYTYNDYKTWGNETRYELIDGVPYMMSSPSHIHQRVLRELFKQLAVFLTGKSCELFSAPSDVRLNPYEYDDIVVQPDLFVVCDKSKLDGQSCIGAPDLIIEILSPSTEGHDRFVKLGLYQKAGVREYWIVDPDEKGILAHTLKDDSYIVKPYHGDVKIPVSVLDGCERTLTDIFAES